MKLVAARKNEVHRLVVQPPTSSSSAIDVLINQLEGHFIGKI